MPAVLPLMRWSAAYVLLLSLWHSAAKECVNLLVIGDYGSRTEDQANVAAGLASVSQEMSPVAISGIGDNIYPEGAKYDWAIEEGFQLIEDWWLKVYSAPSLKRPWNIIMGNHDWYSDARTELYFVNDVRNAGGFWKMDNFWYKRSYAGDGFTVDIFYIDTMIWKGSSMPDRIVPDARASQKEWLKQGLENSSADWKIVMGHHPIWSAGSHGRTHVLVEELDPMLRQYGVPIYVAGHDHSQQVIQDRGLNYVISGAGGKHARNPSHDYPRVIMAGKHARNPSHDYPRGSLKHYLPELGFASLSICNKEQASLDLYDAEGNSQVQMVFPNQPPQAYLYAQPHQLYAPCHGVWLKDVDRHCSADGCRVLVDGIRGRSCSEYCAEQGLGCAGAWTEEMESCGGNVTLSCATGVDGHGEPESERICQCAPSATPMPILP